MLPIRQPLALIAASMIATAPLKTVDKPKAQSASSTVIQPTITVVHDGDGRTRVGAILPRRAGNGLSSREYGQRPRAVPVVEVSVP